MEEQPKNKILRRLPAHELQEFMHTAELVTLERKDLAFEPGKKIESVFYVEQGMFSLLSLADGCEIETATIGLEGMSAIPLLLGKSHTFGKCFCQVQGSAWLIRAERFKHLMQHCPELVRLSQQFAFSVYEQTAQNSACNRLHSIEQRCAKWLLLTDDRVERRGLELTQEFLANMLGVGRNGVGSATAALQEAGHIRYSRGVIRIVNRDGLESVSCGCYAVIRKSIDELQTEVPV